MTGCLMKKFLSALAVSLLTICPLFAQNADDQNEDSEIKYRRSSLYSVLVKHSAYPYAAEIESAFMLMPIPDKFNDHNLTVRSFESTATRMKKKGKEKNAGNMQDIDNFFSEQEIAKMLVSKWFNRNPSDGTFNMELIQERGFYDASQLDISMARESARGILALGDAGEDLIGNTFVIVNDITFVDKGETSSAIAGLFKMAGDLAAEMSGNANYQAVGNLAAVTTNEIDGFKVNITTYLYRLIWDEEAQAVFYQDYWLNGDDTDSDRKTAFETSDLFKVQYVGQTTTSAANLSSKSFSSKSKEDQMLRVCARAVDKSIVELQREYDDFKVKVPIYRISEEDKTVEVQIGLKEGINEKSRFEVLMPVEDENGKTSYERVAMIQPLKDKIWDNRFGALEEAKEAAEDSGETDAEDFGAASLTASTFKILNGANKIVPGCLVREVTIKR